MSNKLVRRAAAGVRKHMGKAAKCAAVAIAFGTAHSTHALTNSFSTVTGMFDSATEGFDWGMTTALGVVGVVVIVGWLKYGVKGTFGSKKTG